jgi:hypothetical protein
MKNHLLTAFENVSALTPLQKIAAGVWAGSWAARTVLVTAVGVKAFKAPDLATAFALATPYILPWVALKAGQYGSLGYLASSGALHFLKKKNHEPA